uniref:DUF7939 domain-containing protein n=1 Tax=uncultured Alphaproteobacteria bacterium TaxID=91750 RepID=A0A6G8F2W1_9PROT|nr:hypothetical protein PlAlph_4890 [uncultured Alphaproteobacteria bacterium]
MLKFAVWFFGILFFSCPVYAENFIAKVNRNPVPLGETFVLTLQYDGNPGQAEPDLSPLNKDFTVYSVGREQQHSNINGKTSRIYRWNVVMSPKVSGSAHIPSISFRNLSSRPITVKVASDAGTGNVPRFSIGREVNTQKPLVQEQMIYTLVLKTTEEIQGSLPQFADGGNDWIVKQLDEPTVASEIENGLEVRKIEIRYAMFPQKSGKLSVPELRFNGYYIDKSKRRSDPFGSAFNAFMDDSFISGFGATPGLSRINLAAQPLEVDVQPIPAVNNGYWWLPSSQVEISSDWEKSVPSFKAGEAVNRKITLTAAGVADSQLPKLAFKEVDGLKQYPEKPEVSSIATEDGIVSSMVVNVVYIPERGGAMTVPEVVVPWYNVKTQQMEKAVLPAVQIQVEGSTSAAVSPVEKKQNIAENATVVDNADIVPIDKPLPLKVIAAFVTLAFAAGLGIGWLVLRSRCMANIQPTSETAQEELPQKNIKSAFRSGDLKDIRNQILIWARNIYPDAVILNLDDVSELFGSSQLSSALKQLGSALYSGKKDAFDSHRLEEIILSLSAAKKSSKEDAPLLPKLYK